MSRNSFVHLGVAEEETQADHLGRRNLAESTMDDRQRFWDNIWVPWAESHGFRALPATAETWLLFLEDHRHLAPKTLRIYGEGLQTGHNRAGYISPTHDPTVGLWMRAYRQSETTDRPGPADPAVYPVLARLVHVVYEWHRADNPIATRTWAHMLALYAVAGRYDDLANVDVDHPTQPLRESPQGFHLWVRKNKTHQTDGGYPILIPHTHHTTGESLCPACAMREYISLWRVKAGALFQATKNGKGAGRAVDPGSWKPNVRTGADGRPSSLSYTRASREFHDAAKAAGLTEEGVRITTHSFKSGSVTQSYREGDDLEAIATKIGTSLEVAYRFYLRLDPEADLAGYDLTAL